MTRRGRPAHPDILTPAEWRVVEAVRHGLSNPDIARAQGVSLDAVKYHVANALGKLGLGSRRQLRHWDGVSAASAIKGRERTMTGEIRPEAIGQVARTVRDIKAASEWYSGVLGLTHLYSFGNLAFFDCGGVRLFLSEAEEAQPESILYFRVADIRAAHDALSAKGVEFVNAPHMIHRHENGLEEWMAFFNDCDGRPLALMARIAP